jgi:hypothetical protein
MRGVPILTFFCITLATAVHAQSSPHASCTARAKFTVNSRLVDPTNRTKKATAYSEIRRL